MATCPAGLDRAALPIGAALGALLHATVVFALGRIRRPAGRHTAVPGSLTAPAVSLALVFLAVVPAVAGLAATPPTGGRGVPVIYYGDEQGFTGDGDDRRARQDMFDTQVPSYADDRRIGSAAGPYDINADMYRRMAEMTRVRAADARLRRGAVKVRVADQEPGVLALSRLDEAVANLKRYKAAVLKAAVEGKLT